MFVLVSDYDGTFKTRIHDLKINIREIKKFRERGNIFAIATGRPFSSIEKEINKHGIELDFLACNDGAAIFDDKLNQVKAHYLTPEQLTFISSLLGEYPNLSLGRFFSPKEIFKNSIPEPIEIEIIKEPGTSFKPFISNLQLTYPSLHYFKAGKSLFIKGSVTKSTAVAEITNCLNFEVPKKHIYTIGDELNDIEMIRDYNGVRMFEAHPRLWLATPKFVFEEHHLVKYLNFRSKKASK